MAYKDKQRQIAAANSYNKVNYDRITITVKKGDKAKIQVLANASGETVNGYIKRALAKSQKLPPKDVVFCEEKICDAFCPSCGSEFPDVGGICESYGEVEQFPFCPNCGQAIDWTQEILVEKEAR